MQTYIVLAELTEQGIQNIKGAPERIEQSAKDIEAVGGKLAGFYTVMGEYDYVVIFEAPSDEVFMTFLIGLGKKGSVRTKTLRAFTKEELAEIVKTLP